MKGSEPTLNSFLYAFLVSPPSACRHLGSVAVTLRVTTSRAPGSLGTHSLIHSSHRQELLPCARTLLGAGAQQGMVDILGFLVELAF